MGGEWGRMWGTVGENGNKEMHRISRLYIVFELNFRLSQKVNAHSKPKKTYEKRNASATEANEVQQQQQQWIK